MDNWETIGKINTGIVGQHICKDCGEDMVGVYFEIRNKETEEIKTLCDICHQTYINK